MAIADVYDALISERPYKRPMSHDEACRIMTEGAGSHFDPRLISVFIGVQDRFAYIADSIGDN
jgi:putative two-component system response regulator